MTSDIAKACPWCGGKPGIDVRAGNRRWRCLNCYGAPGLYVESQDEADRLWNRRTPPLGGTLCTFGPPAERRRHWILKFEDADVGDMHFDDEAEAFTVFERKSTAWNCHLFVTASRPAPPAQSVELAKEALTDAQNLLRSWEETPLEEWNLDTWATDARDYLKRLLASDRLTSPPGGEDAVAELRAIDGVLARRPALDKPTRWQNIEHAINTARNADIYKAALEKLRAYNIDIQADRINYRPMDHVQVIDRALVHSPAPVEGPK